MNRLCKNLLLSLLLLALSGALAWGEEASSIDRALEAWSGERTVLLRTGLADPLSSPLVQDLLADLVSRNFTVTPTAHDAMTDKGLVLDVRDIDDAPVLALIRAEDGAIIAFEKRAARQPASAEVKTDASEPAETAKAAPASPSCLPAGLNELEGHPRSVAVLTVQKGRCGILALYDDALVLYDATRRGLQRRARFASPERPSRALHLDAGDIDADGEKEIAVVWAEDEKSIYEGAETQLHAWILSWADGAFHRASRDLRGYVRISDGKGYLQRRGRHDPFAAEVFSLSGDAEGFAPEEAVDWPDEAGLYALTPFRNRRAFLSTGGNRPGIVSFDADSSDAVSRMAETLGAFDGPEVAVRRAEAEYRLGLSKEDQVRTDYHPLPRPVAVSPQGDIYTVRRGRTLGLPLVSKTAGRDEIVQLVAAGNALEMRTPFIGVSAFILDFALLETGGGTSALLLVNEEPAGQGTAYLTLQTPQNH